MISESAESLAIKAKEKAILQEDSLKKFGDENVGPGLELNLVKMLILY